jgi:DNA/RNA-binding domain of Phe-tRNA-synthetase-like protein
MLDAGAHSLSLTLDEALRGILAVGLLEAERVRLEPEPPEFAAECARVLARLTATHAGRAPGDIPGVAETRAMFHRLDIDPTKTRPSSEALLRRALQGRGLPRVNLAVDVCNLCSVEDQLPLGLYDRDTVRGAVCARLGVPGEGYPGIRKQRVNLAARPLLADDEGPFGAPTSDSARTSVTAATHRLLVAVFCPVPRAERDLPAALERIAGRLTRWCDATVVAVRTAQ